MMGVDGVTKRVRVLIVDDHPLFRHGLCWALNQEQEFEIVGVAESGEEALRLASELAPDMVVCGVELPDARGVDVARRLKNTQPAAVVVLLSALDDEEELFEALRVGAAGYFLKTTRLEPLVDGLRRAVHGEAVIDERVMERPQVAARVLREFGEMSSQVQAIEPLFVPLSAREREVLDHIARGNSNKQIAQALYLSDSTVKNHISSILRKLAVNDRTAAVVYALRQGWIQGGRV